MGCGCGKRKTQRTARTGTVVNTAGQNKIQSAQTFQSATVKKPPTGPMTTRKTV